MPSRTPLYSLENLPIYGSGATPVFADGVIDSGKINLLVSWSAYPDLDIAVGFSGSTGVGWSVPAGSAAEMAALDWASSDNTNFGPEWVYVDVSLMIFGNCGKGNDGTNDYYEIRVAAGWYTAGATGGGCTIRAIYGALSDTATVFGLPNNNRHAASNHVATLRWTPATSTLAFV